jgi:UDP-N-acetylglucosamine 2-epimerase (non-hydrolysing)
MPEEVNRVVTDHVADLLFVTEPSGVVNLSNEGIPASAVHFVGNTMIDSLLASLEKAEGSTILETLGLRSRGAEGGHVAHYVLLTLHRPANVDNPVVFRSILAGLEELAAEYPIVFPMHPRTQARIREFGLEPCIGTQGNGADADMRNGHHGIITADPLGYLDFLCLMKNAALVVTDSGGIQEETTCQGVPSVTVRDNTERPETVERGTNVIAGTTQGGIAAAVRRQLSANGTNVVPEKWDGQAGRRIVEILVDTWCNRMPAVQTVMESCIRT